MSTDRIGFHSTLMPYINHKVAIYSIVNGLKKTPLSTDSLAKLLSDSLLSNKVVIDQFNTLITFKVAVWINQSNN